MSSSAKVQSAINKLDNEIRSLNLNLKTAYRALDTGTAHTILDRLGNCKTIREGLATELEAVKVTEAAAAQEAAREQLKADLENAKSGYDAATAEQQQLVAELCDVLASSFVPKFDALAARRFQANATFTGRYCQLHPDRDRFALPPSLSSDPFGNVVDKPEGAHKLFLVTALCLSVLRAEHNGSPHGGFDDAARGLGLVAAEKWNYQQALFNEPRPQNPPEQRLDPVDLARCAGVGVTLDGQQASPTPPTPEALELARSVGIDLTPR